MEKENKGYFISEPVIHLISYSTFEMIQLMFWAYILETIF